MEIIIKATSEEITALVLAAQGRCGEGLVEKVTQQITENLEASFSSARIPGSS